MANCLYCNKFFVPRLKGPEKKFCSTKCRVTWHRMWNDPADNQYHQTVYTSRITNMTLKAAVFVCESCGKRMHRKKKYCSAACKQAAYRKRKERKLIPA